jgi:hypothetical protein
VHEAEVRARVCDDAGELRVAAQGRDIVDEHGTELDRAARDLSLGGVDRDRHGSCEALEHRHDAAQLLVERDRLRPGPRRLTADVDDGRALGRHAPGRRDRILSAVVEAAVRERVRRHVHDPHHRWAGKTLLEWDTHRPERSRA